MKNSLEKETLIMHKINIMTVSLFILFCYTHCSFGRPIFVMVLIKHSEKHIWLTKYHVFLVSSLNECSDGRKLLVLDNSHSSVTGQNDDGFDTNIFSAYLANLNFAESIFNFPTNFCGDLSFPFGLFVQWESCWHSQKVKISVKKITLILQKFNKIMHHSWVE